MDRKELLAKIDKGEIKDTVELEQVLLEEYPGKKTKKAIGFAKGMMREEGRKDLTSFLIYFDKAQNPDSDFDSAE